MPRSLGIFSLVASYFAVPGATIRTENHNPPLEDIAQAITDSLPRDGSAPMTGNLPMGNRKITGLANGTAAGDAAAFGQLSSLVVGPASAAADRIAVFDGVTGKLIKDGGKTVAEISSAIAVTDWDAIAASGFYYGLGTAANAPSAHHYSGFYSGDATNGTMIVGRAGLEMNFTRRKGGGFWGDWMPISSGWTPANGFTGLRYDSAVNGSVASVSSSVWEDGWEYMLVYDGVGGASGNLMLSLERESGGFSGAVAISGTGNVVHYGELVFQLPRMEKFSHIATETTASMAAPANTFNTNVTYQSCGITHAVATKIKSAVLTNSAGNITSGKVYEFRRPEGTS